MELKFTKMHGCGNDYIYFNCMNEEIDNPNELSILLSHRHFSIGGDGIVLILPSDSADAKMRMFNADGSEGKMCGNAIRCVGKFLYDKNIVKNDVINIETLSGVKTLELTVQNDKVKAAKVNMGKAILNSKDIPTLFSEERVIDRPIIIDNVNYNITCVSMGNPHCVVFVEDVDLIDIEKIGPQFENYNMFPERINTEFVEIIDKNTLKMRVWERGSGETWACGTGACASVVAACLNNHCKMNEDVLVKLKGGDLIINYMEEAVFMTGPAVISFEGCVNTGGED